MCGLDGLFGSSSKEQKPVVTAAPAATNISKDMEDTQAFSRRSEEMKNQKRKGIASTDKSDSRFDGVNIGNMVKNKLGQ